MAAAMNTAATPPMPVAVAVITPAAMKIMAGTAAAKPSAPSPTLPVAVSPPRLTHQRGRPLDCGDRPQALDHQHRQHEIGHDRPGEVEQTAEHVAQTVCPSQKRRLTLDVTARVTRIGRAEPQTKEGES